MRTICDDVKAVSDMVNNMGFSESKFCDAFQYEHRTLQQSFTRLCIEWLKTCASEDYQYDPRNEASHVVAKKLIEAYDGTPLWFI